MLEVRLLGQFHVQENGRVIRIPSRPAQSLLAYLALTAGTVHRREKLAGLFWPDSTEANARSNLRHALWRLRRDVAICQDCISADGLTVAFDGKADFWLDTAVLDRKISEKSLLNELLDAVSVYKGELLPGFYYEWVALERERLQAVFEQKMGLLLERLVQAGRWSEVIDRGEYWIALGQVPEPAYRALMVAHAGLGDLYGMAAVYQRCVEALQQELDVEPSEQTQTLFGQLAQGELPAPGPDASPELWQIQVEEEPEPGEPPYKGLRFFEEADAVLFFGREQATATMFARLRSSRLLAVVGASGSGKSSVVRAGLVPALKRAAVPDTFHAGTGPWASTDTLESTGDALLGEGHEDWLVHVITPSAHPLEALAASLTRDEVSVTATATLMDDLARDARSLHLCVQRKLSGNQRPLLLVVDQFEELFTLCRSEMERQAFVDNLLTAACPPVPSAEDDECAGADQIAIVVALSAEFYAHCGQYAGLREVLEHHQVFVGPMSTRELRQAMEEPARQGGWAFEAGLVDLLLQEVGDEPGALPLLSHALLETWHRRRGRTMTLSGYHESGGVRGAIAQTANRVFGQLDLEEQAIARGIFLRLTELGEGTQDTRRRVKQSELVTDSADASQVEAVLHTLADARLVTIGEETVEVAHEVLIREWPTLRYWLDEDRAAIRLHRHLTEAAQSWQRRGRDQSELYRGTRLAQVSEWTRSHTGELNPLEREFLSTSQDRERQRAEALEAQRQREMAAESLRAEEHIHATRRLRWLVAGLGMLLLIALVSVFLAFQQAQRAEQQTNLATSRELAAAALSQLDADPELSMLLALEAVNITFAAEGKVLPEAANALHRAIPASRVELTLAGHESQVWALAYSPDGARLATGSHDGTVKVWDTHTGQIVLTLSAHAEPAQAVAFSPGGARLASAGLDKTAKLWDAATGQLLLTLSGHAGPVWDLEFSPDGTRLVTAGDFGPATVWDVSSGKALLSLKGHNGAISGVAYSPSGRHLATAGTDSTARVWDAESGQELLRLTDHTSYVSDVAFSTDGTRLATASMDSTAMVWDVSTLLSPAASTASASSSGEGNRAEGPTADTAGAELLLTLSGHTSELLRVAFSLDGTHLATTSADRKVFIWDLASGTEVRRLAGHGGWVTHVAFSPDGHHLATASQDTTARVWDWASPGRELLTLAGHDAQINDMTLSPDGMRLATTGLDSAAKVWDLATGDELLTLDGAGRAVPRFWRHEISFSPDGTRLATVSAEGIPRVWDAFTGQKLLDLKWHAGLVSQVAYSPDGTLLATASHDRTAKIWDAATGQELAVLRGHDDHVLDVAFSPDGTRLATASGDQTAKIWDLSTRRELFTLAGHTDSVYKTVFSLDGSQLATIPTDFDHTVKVWDVASGQEIHTLAGHTDSVRKAFFSADGARLFTAGRDGTARVWNLATGEEVLTLTGHTSTVFDLALSPDETLLATAGYDATARVWDLAAGQELLVLTGHTNGVHSVAFSPDGRRLISGSDDGTVRVYALPIEELVALAKTRLTRGWTEDECRQFLHLPVDQCPPSP